MLWPLSETLKLIEPDVPAQLVSPEAFSHVQTIATLLPNALSSYYWECRLAANAIQVDFLTRIAVPDGGREILTGQNTGTGLPNHLLEHPVWSRAHEFFRQWADSTSILHEHIPLIWLEFDHIDSPIPNTPLPSFSFVVVHLSNLRECEQ